MTSDAGPAGPRITIGIDGSAASAAALCWALREARLRGAVLQVVHAWQPAARGRAPYAPGPWVPGREADRHAAEALLAAAVRHAHHAAGLAADDRPALRLEAVEGLPAKVLLDRACGAELLVLGGVTVPPGGGGHRPDCHVSPVALACLRAAPCPVVVVTVPVLTVPVLPGPVLAGPVLPGPVLPGPVLPGPVLPGPVLPGPVLPAQPRKLSRHGARAGRSAR